MKCIECNKEMKLVGGERFYLSETSEATSVINEYDCPTCGIKIFFNMSIDGYGIEKLFIPDNLKPTDKQLDFADYIVSVIPELKYVRQRYYTKRQLSEFISKYKEEAIITQKEKQKIVSKKAVQSISNRRNIKKRSK